jgi:ATP adenylyltransferase
MSLVRDCQKALSETIQPHGFNVGMNFGRCAGAGLPDHLHIHVVPRWNGDTNYMHVCSDTDVISQSLCELYGQLVEVSQIENLPKG